MDSITKLVFLASLLLVVLPSLEDVVGSVLPLVVLLHLPVPLLEGGVGGVDHVGQGLAVVLHLAVAEAQGPHAAHLHDDDGNHGTDEDQHGGFHHLAVADLSVSARHPAGAGDWPGDGGISEVDEVDGQGDSDEDEHEEGEEEGGQDEEDEKKGK